MAQLTQLGLGRAELLRWLRAGAIQRVSHGVYAPTDEQQLSLQLPRACFGGGRAAPLLYCAEQLGLWIPPQLPVQARAPQRIDRIPSEHLQVLGDVTITDLSWTAVNLARGVGLAGALVALDSAHRLGATPAALQVALDEVAGRPGTGLLELAMRLADQKSESPLEAFARGRFFELGLPAPIQQLELRVQGRKFRPDFAWPDWRLIAEADGEAKYSDPDEERRQRHRQHLLHEAGWEVLRFGWPDVKSATAGFGKVLRRRLLNAKSGA